MSRLYLVGLAAVALWLVPVAVYAGPPPPPPTPGCGPCGGPPPPPSRIPTLGPTSVPKPTIVLGVSFSPTHVRRGKQARLEVNGATRDVVTAQIRYHKGKPVVFKGALDAKGSFVKVWKVPKTAPLGKANLTVTLAGATPSQPSTVEFVVIR